MLAMDPDHMSYEDLLALEEYMNRGRCVFGCIFFFFVAFGDTCVKEEKKRAKFCYAKVCG